MQEIAIRVRELVLMGESLKKALEKALSEIPECREDYY
jgi:hypothetical protein